MKIKNRDGCTCVGALRLASIDVGFDLRATGAEAAGPWAGAAEYDQRLHRVYARYTTRDLLGAASAKCRGGE